jgi:hypothetical protein
MHGKQDSNLAFTGLHGLVLLILALGGLNAMAFGLALVLDGSNSGWLLLLAGAALLGLTRFLRGRWQRYRVEIRPDRGAD